jgi:hypothetical protein
MPEPNYTKKGATFSPCENYRYTLLREWSCLSDKAGYVLFIMLNPSTADEHILDPTVRRCVQYAIDWGYKEMHVVNIFAWRSTDPKGLDDNLDPIGIDNDKCIYSEVEEADLVIAAWGTHGTFKNRGEQVTEMITKLKNIYCLKKVKGDIPGHPLYLKRNLTPIIYSKKKGG